LTRHQWAKARGAENGQVSGKIAAMLRREHEPARPHRARNICDEPVAAVLCRTAAKRARADLVKPMTALGMIRTSAAIE
jgi:hypothetical protein